MTLWINLIMKKLEEMDYFSTLSNFLEHGERKRHAYCLSKAT